MKEKKKKERKKLLLQDRMLSIPNYNRRTAHQNDNKKPNITRLAILKILQTVNAS